MKLGSLFDGSGTAPLCAAILGWEPVWASEIEAFPVKVTSKRFPRMKHLGDITKINGGEIEPVDAVVGGSPCQDLSVAGKQAGLQGGTRSHLFYEMVRIIKEMRRATNGKYPRYIVWENVPGAFSSNQGRDFHEVLKAFCACADHPCDVSEPPRKGRAGADKLVWGNAGCIVGDGFSLGWRVLDAQYWGVPQRRRRIFLVVDLGGERAGEILFEREGLRRDLEQSREARKGAAAAAVGSADRSAGATGFDGYNGELTGDVSSSFGVNCGMSTGRNGIVLNDQGAVGINGDVAGTLDASDYKGCGIRQGIEREVIAVPCMNTQDRHATCYAIDQQGGKGAANYAEDICPTLCSDSHGTPHAVAAFMGGQGEKAGGIGYSEECAPTIKSVMSGGNTIPDVVYANTGAGWWNESKTAETIRTPCGGDATKANLVVWPEVSRTLTAEHDASPCVDRGQNITAYTAYCRNGVLNEELSGTLQAKPNGGQSLNCINPVVYDCRGNGDGKVAPNLTGDHQNRVTDYSACVVYPGVGITSKENASNPQPGDPCCTLDTDSRKYLVAENEVYPEVTGPLMANSHPGSYTGQDAFSDMLPVYPGKPPRRYFVRRLTPMECCRLQGFPDWWVYGCEKQPITGWWLENNDWMRVIDPHGEVEGSDSAIYKMWGNGMALPCMLFVLSGLEDGDS